MRRALSVAAMVSVVAFAGSVRAQSEPTVEQIKQAEADFTRGRENYKKGSYTEAAEAFESADGHAPNERVIELAILARDKAGALDRAATLAALAIERHPDSARLQELTEPILTRAKQELLQVTVECDEPCALLDGTRIIHGQPASERLVYLTPGKHTIRAGWSVDRADSVDVQGEAGSAERVSFEAPEIPEEPVPAAEPMDDPVIDAGPQEPPSGLNPVFFWVGAGVTAAVGGVAIWSGVDTLNNPGKERVREQCAGQGTDCPDYEKGKSKELRTNILLGATGAVGIGTIVLGAFFTNWSGESSAHRGPNLHSASISPWIGVGDGATLGAKGRF